jgi:hypothetical protein
MKLSIKTCFVLLHSDIKKSLFFNVLPGQSTNPSHTLLIGMHTLSPSQLKKFPDSVQSTV